MNAIRTVARKELRGFFQSPVALLFLGVFLLVTLFTFFTAERFFARNIADLRPLFEWLPVLLILLVSAVTMRAWAEERKMGTLELLLTLPLTTRDLVLGKFAAAVALVGVALALTLPLPLMVSTLGELDWGPVVGGYVGALLLGATYVAIGLCVSARTDNQVVALMTTLGVGGAIYLIGSPSVVDLAGTQGSELLRSLGTGSRFESIERGVFDLRDLVYYAGITVVALFANVAFLESARLDRGAAAGRASWRRVAAVTALVAANVVLANVWLAPVTAARIDLTENDEYSLSDVTRRTLAALDEPLYIDGYFSERSHPLLTPLVPQIRDLLAEYEVAGRGRVRVAFADPNLDEELEERIQQDFGVRSTPFRVADRTQQSVVNAFFHVVVRYGDQYEVLSFDDLIEVRFDGESIDVRLRNLEYDVTRAIRRVSQDFQTIDSLLASVGEPVRMQLYASPSTMPEEFSSLASTIRTVGEELAERSSNFAFEEIDPSSDQALQQRIFRDYNVRPLSVDPFSTETFYLDVVVSSGARVERIVPREDLGQAELRGAVEAAVRRLTPGQLTTVGLVTRTPEQPQFDPNIPPQFQPRPEPPDYRMLEQILGETYEVRRIELAAEVPADVDVVLIAKPDDLSDTQQWALDQYLMRGGAVIALAGNFRIHAGQNGLEARRAGEGLAGLLASWGVTVEPGMVLDPQNATFPIPVQERRGNLILERIELMDYPLFPDVRADGFDRAHPALAGLSGVTVPWASALAVGAAEGVEAIEVLRTTDASWVQSSANVNPDFSRYPERGFPSSDTATAGRQVVAVTLSGPFDSAFADRPSPVFGADAGTEGSGDATGRTLRSALPSARLAVVGSSELVSDLTLSLSQQPGGEVHRGNVQFVQNLIDWAVEDTDLLDIRSSGAFARTLRPMTEGEYRAWEAGQFGIAAVLVAILGAVPWYRRRNARSISAAVAQEVSR